MKILIIHQNFPGQYKHLAPMLAAGGKHQVFAITDAANDPGGRDLCGVQLWSYRLDPPGNNFDPLLRGTNLGIQRGRKVLDLCRQMKKQGFVPDLICVHPGWGDALFLREAFPKSLIVGYAEYFHQVDGSIVGFDPEFPPSLEERLATRTSNMISLLAFQEMDWAVTPTHWQHSLQPAEHQPRISVIFDGIDSRYIRPRPDAYVDVPERKLRLTAKDKVVTYVNRGLEPIRGWHNFVRAVPLIQRQHPDAHIVVVGSDQASYWKGPEPLRFKEKYLAEVRDEIDPARLHFLGRLDFQRYLSVLQISSAHIYLTAPFVLSWSMIESMSAGCPLIASRTPPVLEAVEDGVNGLLVDFFSPADIAAGVGRVLGDRALAERLGSAARETVLARYDLNTVCLPQQARLLNDLRQGRPPA